MAQSRDTQGMSSSSRKPMPEIQRGARADSGQDISFKCTSYIPPAIPDGEYEAMFIKAEKNWMWGQEKLFLWFQIITQGKWVSQKFFAPFNIPSKGNFTVSTKYWLWWVFAAGRRPGRADRLSPNVFKNQVFRVRMRTVLKTAKQTDRTPEQQYSIVDELLGIQ